MMTEQELDRLLDAWEAPEPSSTLRAKLERQFPAPVRRRVFGMPLRWAAALSLGIAGVAVGTTMVALDPVIGTSWGQLMDGTHIRVKTLVEPRLALLKYFRLGVYSTTGGMRRGQCVVDRQARTYYCYELTFQPLGEGRYHASAAPFEPPAARRQRYGIDGFRSIAPPSLPGRTTIGEHEALDVFLIREPDGARVFDRIELSSTGFDDVPHKRPLNEGPMGGVMMRLSNPKLYVDGVLIAEGPLEARGPTVWFGLEGRGLFTLAVDTFGDKRFVQTGRARGSTIEFSAGGSGYRIVCDKPVTTSADRPLYVLHDAQAAGNYQGEMASFGSAGPPGLK